VSEKLENKNFQFSKILVLILVFFTYNSISAQEELIIEEQTKDSVFDDYIIDYKTRFNVKLEVSNDILAYKLESSDEILELKPNLNVNYAVVFSYKFLSVQFGLRPQISDKEIDKKGGSDTFRLRVELLFDNWNHIWEYSIDKGYYVVNTSDFVDDYTDVRIQAPEMSSKIIFGNSSYKFNNNYSRRALESQTEIQNKSAGSFMPGINYALYSLTGLDVIKDENGDRINRDNYNEYIGVNFAITAGYYYTFVLKKHWFLTAYVVPAIGINFTQTTNFSPEGSEKSNFDNEVLNLDYSFGGGYNNDKIFFGARFNNGLTNEKFNSEGVRITPSSNQWGVYFGYRFKAPKFLSKPVDLIEEKVPILKDDH